MTRRIHLRHIGFLALSWLLACDVDPVGPVRTPIAAKATDAVASREPHFVTAAADAPGIANPVVSFYAKLGEDREAFMYYQARPGVRDSTVFVRFRVPKRSLAARPDGTPFAPGDSILITFTLVDAVHLQVDFQPAGLTFSSRDPAKLKMSFLEVDEDLNGDGVVDQEDSVLAKSLAIWRREGASDPWVAQPSVVKVGVHEVQSEVFGFTSYVIAW